MQILYSYKLIECARGEFHPFFVVKFTKNRFGYKRINPDLECGKNHLNDSCNVHK